MSENTLREFFGRLPRVRYGSYRELQETILPQFNSSLSEFAPGYSHMQLIEWAVKQGWIIRQEDGSYTIAGPK